MKYLFWGEITGFPDKCMNMPFNRANYNKSKLKLKNSICQDIIQIDFTIETERIRDWSLITGRGGGLQKKRGHVKYYPYEKGGGRKKF